MFKSLKEKLGKWAKKISKEKEIVEDTKPKKGEKVKEKKPKKFKELPMKFNVGVQKFEPDLEKIEEQVKDIEKQEEKEEFKPERKGIFKKIKYSVSKVKISEEVFKIYSEELEMLLLENNVALEVAEKMIQELKYKIVGKEFLKKEVEPEIRDALKEIIEEILVEPFDIIKKIKEKDEPFVILFCGINGTGKTTTIAKVGQHLKDNKLSCVLAAADTFRAASIEQIKIHAKKLGLKVIAHDYGSDPAAVGFDAIKYAKKNKIDCVLIDTAGRMHTSKNLLKEIEKIARVCKPDLKIFVGESITGNDAIEQVKSFDWELKIDGIVLTKADIDEKGGTALSVGYITKKPILYLGTGQEYDKIEPFDKKKFIEKLGL